MGKMSVVYPLWNLVFYSVYSCKQSKNFGASCQVMWLMKILTLQFPNGEKNKKEKEYIVISVWGLCVSMCMWDTDIDS